MTKTYTRVAAKRSQNLPLHVLSLSPPEPAYRAQTGAPERIINFIINILYRIKVLCIKSSTAGLRLLTAAAPLLEEFWLQAEPVS